MLSVIEGRVLGCLLEKERATPDQYPLTLNALVSACNQSTSREPVMHLADHEVDGVLAELKAEGLLRFVHPSHGRSVTRYRQVADEAWGLEAPAAAVIAVLLLRGPQTAAELRARTERLHPFDGVDDVEAVLRRLAEAGQVRLLDRMPGQKEARWQQLLAEEAEVVPAPAAAQAGASGDHDGAARSAGGSVASMSARVAELEGRVARLEAALADFLT